MIYNTLLLAVLAQILRWKIPFCSRERGVKVDPSALAKQQKRANALCHTAISSSAFAAARSARDTSGTSWSENGARQQQFTALYGRRLLLLGESIFRRWFIFYACPTACKIFTPTRCHFVVQNFATYIYGGKMPTELKMKPCTHKNGKNEKIFCLLHGAQQQTFFPLHASIRHRWAFSYSRGLHSLVCALLQDNYYCTRLWEGLQPCSPHNFLQPHDSWMVRVQLAL